MGYEGTIASDSNQSLQKQPIAEGLQ